MLQQTISERDEMSNKSDEIKIVISKADGQNILLRSEECEFENMKLVRF